MSDPVQYLRIFEGQPLPEVAPYAPFRAVVIIDAPYSSGWQKEVSDWLVASGCLFMLAWGEGCSSWDDSVDWANIDQFSPGEIPEDRFVMTTWHENQSLDEVFWDAQFIGTHGVATLRWTLLLHISAMDSREEMLSRFAIAREME